MKINYENALINNSALLTENSIGEINTCPFCGAPIVYLREEDTRLFAENLTDEEKTILDHAMKLEIFNGDFYKRAALMAKKESVSEMFRALSSIEMMHANIHRKLVGAGGLPNLRKIDYTKYENDQALMEAAGIREEHAVAYYKKYLDKISNESVKLIFKVLSQIEGEHIILLNGRTQECS